MHAYGQGGIDMAMKKTVWKLYHCEHLLHWPLCDQMHWEDDVIWDGEEAKQRVLQSHKQRAEFAGWVPSANSRTAAQFLQQGKSANLPAYTHLAVCL